MNRQQIALMVVSVITLLGAGIGLAHARFTMAIINLCLVAYFLWAAFS